MVHAFIYLTLKNKNPVKHETGAGWKPLITIVLNVKN